MRGTGLLFQTTPHVEEFIYTAPPRIEQLHSLVGGYLEHVHSFDTIARGGDVLYCVTFCDEDGKRKQLPINHAADRLWQEARRRNGRHTHPGDRLVGNVLVLFGDREFMSEL